MNTGPESGEHVTALILDPGYYSIHPLASINLCLGAWLTTERRPRSSDGTTPLIYEHATCIDIVMSRIYLMPARRNTNGLLSTPDFTVVSCSAYAEQVPSTAPKS